MKWNKTMAAFVAATCIGSGALAQPSELQPAGKPSAARPADTVSPAGPPATVNPEAQPQSATPVEPGPAPAPVAPQAIAPAPGVPQAATTPAPVSPAAPPANAQAATTQQPASPASPPANAPDTEVVAFVQSQFPAADTNKDGSLSQSEFLPWIAKLKERELSQQGKPATPSVVTAYANDAFKKADLDHNNVITQTELTGFLHG